MAELARKAGVQPSTMIRFAQALGYSGFSDLQLVFQSYARDRWPDYNTRLEVLHDGAHGGDVLSLLGGLVEASCTSARDFRQSVDVEALERAVDRLAAARTIHVVGVRRAFPVAVYLDLRAAETRSPLRSDRPARRLGLAAGRPHRA